MSEEWVLPPHFEVVTFSWHRWLEIFYSLTDQRGDRTVGNRAMIWDALQLTRDQRDGDVSLVFLADAAETLRWWERERVDG